MQVVVGKHASQHLTGRTTQRAMTLPSPPGASIYDLLVRSNYDIGEQRR